MYIAEALALREGDRARLGVLTRASTAPADLVARSKFVLMAADGVPNTKIAARTGTSRPTVCK